MPDLSEMLTYRRPEGSKHQARFCMRYLEPVFGKPDPHGNYIMQIGDSRLMFTSHHDTVHWDSGRQTVFQNGNLLTSKHDCLGADCTTGIWLQLQMIEAGVPGIYIVHAGEEIGCVGSSAFVRDNYQWLEKNVDAVISFDRRGQDSIVTHQMGQRTASDEFAYSLGDILEIPELQPDATGVLTDSLEYEQYVGECTNLSVGYMHQHTKNEFQDMHFAEKLREKLITADWSKLEFHRQPGEIDYWGAYYSSKRSKWPEKRHTQNSDSDMVALVRLYPERVARMLQDWGLDEADMCEQLGLDDSINLSWLFERDIA